MHRHINETLFIPFCSTEKAGSYFPGFPAYSIVPGPDRHRVSYRPGNISKRFKIQFQEVLAMNFKCFLKTLKRGNFEDSISIKNVKV
jgi:hypothetical protein